MNNNPNEINNYDDYLDSRDIQERIDWLEKQVGEYKSEHDASKIHWFFEELSDLNKLKEQYVDSFGENSWEFGAQFIRDSYFEDYAQELADDYGLINADFSWPNTHIDWEAAAKELQQDYTEFDFGGIVYWAREA